MQPDIELQALSVDTAFPKDSTTIHFMDYNITDISDDEDTGDILLINTGYVDPTLSEKRISRLPCRRKRL